MTLEEILANQEVKDELEFELHGQKVRVGDLRGMAKKRAKEIADQQALVDSERKKAEKLADDALKLFEGLRERGVLDKKDGKGGEEDDLSDVDPRLVKKLTALGESLGKINTAQEEIKKSIGSGFSFVLSQLYYPQRWSQVKGVPEGKTWQDYLKIAESKGIKDEMGLFDPVAAFMKEHGTVLAENDKKSEYERGLKEGREKAEAEHRTAGPARPTHRGVPTPAKKDDKAFTSVTDIQEAITADTELMDMLSGGGPVQ